MKSSYVKTLLYAYPNVHKIIKRIDQIVEKKAENSMTDISACDRQCEKIINLTVQKGYLFEVKFYLEKVMNRLTDDEKAYLEYKYFRKLPKEYFENVDLTSRNYYRKQKKLIEYVGNCFDWLNLGDAWFERVARKAPYVKKMLQAIICKEKGKVKNARNNKVA